MGAHGEFAHTDKQAEIMGHIMAECDAGEYLTLARLRVLLSYKASKQAVLCSIMVLENREFLTKKYHGNESMTLLPTALAYSTFRRISAAS